MIGLSVPTYVHLVRKKWLSPYYSTKVWYIHQTCTNCSYWHDLLIPRGALCPWPTFHAWVTMVRKKWLSPYYKRKRKRLIPIDAKFTNLHKLFILTWSTDATCWFVPLTCISRFSDHGQEEMVKSILQYLLVLHSLNLHQLYILTWSTDDTWWFVSLTYISRLSDQC